MSPSLRRRANSAISLRELDVHSRRQVESCLSFSGGESSSGDSTPSAQTDGGDEDQSHHHGCESDQDSSDSSGAGTAVPPAYEPGHETEPLPRQGLLSRLANLWSTQISCEVDIDAARDHLALERTFLGYLRTSMMMSIIGTMIAQLFTVTHHDAGFGYTLVGKPLATTCFIFSIGTIFLGAVRCWRHQYYMVHGKALAGGFELNVIGIGSFLLLMVFFVFLLVIDIVKVTSVEADIS